MGRGRLELLAKVLSVSVSRTSLVTAASQESPLKPQLFRRDAEVVGHLLHRPQTLRPGFLGVNQESVGEFLRLALVLVVQ